MASFADLCRAVLPGTDPGGVAAGAVAGAGPGASARPIGWVRVMKPRVPAFDALEAGDLAIVPAGAVPVVAPSPAEVERLAAGLAESGVAGVIVVGEDAERPGTPAVSLRAALGALGVPAVASPAGDPSSLERSAIAYLVNRRAELDRQAGSLERSIEAHVLAGRGADAIVASIAGFVGRPVAIERRRGEPLAIHAPADRPEALAAGAAAVAAYHARPAAAPLRFPLPGPDGRPAGAIVLLGDEPIRERERVALERISTVVALALGAAPFTGEPGSRAREVLPVAGPPWVVLLARQRGAGLPEERPETLDRLRREVRLLAEPDRIVLRGDAASLELRAVVAPEAGDPGGAAIAERIGALLDRPVAISRAFDDAAGRPAAEADARATLEAVERYPPPERPRVARSDRLPVYRLLGRLHEAPDAARQARALLAPLLAGRPAAVRDRLATLRAVLEGEAGTGVAAALGVHRNTVAYRVRRIESIAGWDLRDPELRLALAVAVRIVQNEQT